MERQSRSPSSEVLAFQYYPIEFAFRAIDQVIFPRHAGNMIRGALGTFLRQTAAADQYASIFRPEATNGPSGFRNPPRPFALRCSHLHRRLFVPGEEFRFSLNLFDIARVTEVESSLREALGRMKDEGIGLGRNRAELLSRRSISTLKTISLIPESDKKVTGIGIEFGTPIELTGYEGQTPLPFGVLFRRTRDRVSTLQSSYGEPLAGIDFRGLGERADLVGAGFQNLESYHHSRKSSRTGATHSIGGFTGMATYRGDLTDFVPWLRVAEATGVGRHTVWGNGQIAVTTFEAEQKAG